MHYLPVQGNSVENCCYGKWCVCLCVYVLTVLRPWELHVQSAQGHLSLTRPLAASSALTQPLSLYSSPAKTWALSGCQTRDRNICLPERHLRGVCCCFFSMGADSLWGFQGLPSSSLSFCRAPWARAALHNHSTFLTVFRLLNKFRQSPFLRILCISLAPPCFPPSLLLFVAQQPKPLRAVGERVKLQ